MNTPMNIELDEKTKREVIQQAKAQLLERLIAQFDVKQIAAEIKNAAVKQAVALLAEEMHSKYKTADVVDRAMQSVEGRIQSKVTDLLSKGIKVSFREGA